METVKNKPLTETLTAIARQYLWIPTLERQNSDRLDFHKLSVGSLRDALEAAYRAGQTGLLRSPEPATTKTPKVAAPVSAGRPSVREAADLRVAMQDHLSPEAVALIACKLEPTYRRQGDAILHAEAECRWFADLLIETLGVDQYNATIAELGL
jgi:hypothetical protein